jgi:hypothetical protein
LTNLCLRHHYTDIVKAGIYIPGLLSVSRQYSKFYLYIHSISLPSMKASLLRPVVLIAYIAANSVAGLVEKDSLPQCTSSLELCQPIICTEEGGLLGGSSESGLGYAACHRSGKAGCKRAITDPISYLYALSAVLPSWKLPDGLDPLDGLNSFNLSDIKTQKLISKLAESLSAERCRVCQDIVSGVYRPCTTANGQPGCRLATLALECAPHQPFKVKCSGEKEPCDYNGFQGCQTRGDKYCTTQAYPSPTSTPTCQCPDGQPNGNQPGRSGYCQGYLGRDDYHYVCNS